MIFDCMNKFNMISDPLVKKCKFKLLIMLITDVMRFSPMFTKSKNLQLEVNLDVGIAESKFSSYLIHYYPNKFPSLNLFLSH